MVYPVYPARIHIQAPISIRFRLIPKSVQFSVFSLSGPAAAPPIENSESISWGGRARAVVVAEAEPWPWPWPWLWPSRGRGRGRAVAVAVAEPWP